MSFIGRLFGKKKSVSHPTTPLRKNKPLKVNLGDTDDWSLQSIVDSGASTEMLVQQTGAEGLSGMVSATITPELARQALKAKQHEHQADNYAHSGQYQKAVKEYKIAIETAPYEDEILYMSLGGALSLLGEYKAAFQYYEIALEINPLNERVAGNLANLKKKTGIR